ncbi:tetratricopeptide repeat protein [Prevotella sp. 10(H)]|uniref:tetratricopeptide repeat protein n=1 Tax=Prevotella sp. 10(H) TaxID=1158294 RepID=UPI0004A6B5F2|nr:tetratricopeptide repeat protein [Prevotella sp. 10(H)]
MKYTAVLLFPILFASCNTNSVLAFGIKGVIALFVLMFILFAVMFYLIARRKKQGEKSLVKFNNDVYIALNKLTTPEQKINMLKNLIERINNDEKYKKDTEWRDKVLVKTYMHLATIYYQLGDEMETLNVCTKIIELDPKDGMAYYNRGSIYSNMGMYEKALHDLNQTIELLPDYASAYNNRGLAHEKMEHYSEAIADFDEAIKLENSPIAYYNRGNTRYEMENYKEALADYQQALNMTGEEQADLINEIEMSIKVTKEKL